MVAPAGTGDVVVHVQYGAETPSPPVVEHETEGVTDSVDPLPLPPLPEPLPDSPRSRRYLPSIEGERRTSPPCQPRGFPRRG